MPTTGTYMHPCIHTVLVPRLLPFLLSAYNLYILQIVYSCDICNKTLASRKSLREHGRTHAGRRPLQCATCAASFRTEPLLRAHQRHCDGQPPATGDGPDGDPLRAH